jgi:hypothetical protein
MAHPLSADLGPGHFHAAPVADLALIADLLIFAAMALPILGRAKDALTEKPVFSGLRYVIDGIRLFYLAVGPLPNHFRRCKTYLNASNALYFIV